MLVQTPSRLLRNETREWTKVDETAFADIYTSAVSKNLSLMREILLEETAATDFIAKSDCTVLLMPLYGEIIINNYYESIAAGESLAVKLAKDEVLKIKNHVLNDQTNVLLMVMNETSAHVKYIKTEMDFNRKNTLLTVCNPDVVPAFVGLYDGRQEDTYRLKNKGSEILGFIINGAFEFQNRLLENRDAIVLSEIETLEFEALSENALLLFLEI